MQDQQSIIIDEFKGLYDRGELRDLNVTQIKPGFFKTLNNFYHQGESLISRPGFAPIKNFGVNKLVRFWPYRRPNAAADEFLMMSELAGVFSLRDSAVVGIIGGLTTGTDWQWFINRDVAYGGETFLNTFLQQPLGVFNSFMQIYKLGSGVVMRNAAGLSPSAAGPMVAVTSATVGVVEAGLHLIAVAYESNTGFITPPGPFVAAVYTPTQYTAPGGFMIDVTNIPVPADPVAFPFKHLLASKVIRPPFNGDVLVPELFFIPGQRFASTITARSTAVPPAVNFYDTSLVVSADYLLDELEVIPAGTGYCTYKNRLVVVGFSGDITAKGGPIDQGYIARVSNPGAYESFSSIEGFIQVFQNDGDALQACWEQNGNLYLAKGNRTYVARDNGGPPNTWSVELVDAAIGCGPYGVARIDNTQNYLVEGGTIIGSRRGIFFFTGNYSTTPLTYNIEATYRRDVNNLTAFSDFFYSKYFYDSYRRLLYWLPQTTSGTNKGSDYMLVGACDAGLSPETIRWSQFNAFTSTDITIPNRFVRDIYTTTQSPSTTYDGAILFLIFDDGPVPTPKVDGALNNTDINAIRTFFSFDQQTPILTGSRTNWELVSFPSNVEELDKLQATNVRVLAKHNNNADPIDFELGAFDFTYNEFSATVPQFFGDNLLPNLVLIPQLYDAPINLRSKLIGIAFSRGRLGGNIQGVPLGSITNSVFIHKLVIFGNKAAQDKLRGNIR